MEFEDDAESQDMRECYWEIFARDRARFKDRIQQTEEVINRVLSPAHREKIRHNLANNGESISIAMNATGAANTNTNGVVS